MSSNPFKNTTLLVALTVCSMSVHAQWIPANPITGAQKKGQALVVSMETGTLQIEVCAEDILHIVYSPVANAPTHKNYMVKNDWPQVDWHFDQNDKDITVSTSRVRVAISRADGTLAEVRHELTA